MDQATKVIEGIGEVGIDTEASPGNGQFYVKMYDGSYDAVGFDTEEEALAELDYIINKDTIDDSFPLSMEYEDDIFEGEYL
jgi:hypothetical protein